MPATSATWPPIPQTNGLFAVTLGPGGEAVGWTGFWQSEWGGEAVWECGWNVVPEAQGRGVATAAAALIIRRRAPPPHAPPSGCVSVRGQILPSNALCRTLGLELLGEISVEYPKDHEMRSNDWRLDVGGPDGAAADAQAS